MDLNFGIKSRMESVRSILIGVKSRVLAYTDAVRGFSGVRRYVSETLGYLFNGDGI